MFKKVLLALAIVVAVLAVVIQLQPPTFRVERSAVLSASPSIVFNQVNDLHKWQAWSPWAKLDPAAKIEFEGPTAGIGAAFSWAGNRQVGEGRMEIVDSQPNQSVRFNLEFLKPFRSISSAEFRFEPEGQQTKVTWSMEGKSNFVYKAMGLVMNCDKMVGGQFEQGFANLNQVLASSKGA